MQWQQRRVAVALPSLSQCWQRKHLCVVVVVVRPSLSPLVGQRHQKRQPRQQRWLSRQYLRPEERGQHDLIARRNKKKQCHHCHSRCLRRDEDAALQYFCGAGNARVFALCCCCCHPVVFVSAHGRRNQQPTKPLREEEEDLMSWLTPAFLVLPKMKTIKNWKVYGLFSILSVFSSSHRIQHRSWRLFLIVWPTYFLGVVRNHVSLGSPNHNLHTRSYRGILCMYLWYSKKKGVNVSNPWHKNTVSGLVLCHHDSEMLAKSADIWLSGQHVANMLPTFPARALSKKKGLLLQKLRNNSPRMRICVSVKPQATIPHHRQILHYCTEQKWSTMLYKISMRIWKYS